MYQRDFILRMLEEIAQLVAGILKLIKNGDIPEAEEQLSNAYTNFLKEETSFFRELSLESLPDILINDLNFNEGQIEMLASLYYADGECNLVQGNVEKAREFFAKSLNLYQYITSSSKTFSLEHQQRIVILEAKLEGKTLE